MERTDSNPRFTARKLLPLSYPPICWMNQASLRASVKTRFFCRAIDGTFRSWQCILPLPGSPSYCNTNWLSCKCLLLSSLSSL